MFIKQGSASVEKILGQSEFNIRQADRRIVEYDPEYVYVVVRALSANKPNSNGDSFPHEELIRLDPVLQRPVYASFIGKGVYINHQHTDDPRYAKGIILDSRYVQGDKDDNHVELLLGIDRQKDPVFARDIERGLINKFSMGASVQFTKCSVCDNEARRKEEFCDHISKHKMRECQGDDGTRKLAYEKCYGVTYNEISAVADPADETAQLIAKIAQRRNSNATANESNINSSHGTVVALNEMNARFKRLEAAIMANRRKTAAPLPPAGGDPMGGPAGGPGGPGEDPSMGGDLMMDDATGGENQTVVDVLKVVEELVTGTLPAADAVQAIESLVGGGVGPEEAPGAEMGMPTPDPMDAGGPAAPTASRFSEWFSRVSKAVKSTKENRAMATRKTAEGDSPKVENQYPYKKRQNDPKQYPNPGHDSRHKSRPASDFASDASEYNKKYINLSAEWVPNGDRRLAGWRVLDGEAPLYMVTGANTWEDQLNKQWDRFADRSYGEKLVEAILMDGLETTMDRVNAIKADVQVRTAAPVLDDKMIKAAEMKAADLAEEMKEDFVVRFVEGIKLALKLQDKNVLDNIIKGAAYAVLSDAGQDTRLAEKIASGLVIEAHVDEAIKKALEFTEMNQDSFEEVRAQAETMAARSVTASTEATGDDVSEEERLAHMEQSVVQTMRRRASKGALKATTAGEMPSRGFDADVTRAVRSGSTISAPPSRPLEQSFGKRNHA